MQLVLLSGGSGKRLWPLSNDSRSKQFLHLLEAPSGDMESMIQRVARQVKTVMPNVDMTFTTNSVQRDSIINQLGDDTAIVIEPERRDTFPAIALVSVYLSKEKRCNDNEVVVVMPCDVYADFGYFETIITMAEAIQNDEAEIMLMGVKPNFPSDQYGYIVPSAMMEGQLSTRVARFVEKPNTNQAENLLAEGACWNAGVFAFKLGFIINLISQYCEYDSYVDVLRDYSKLPKISFDYEVVEKSNSVAFIAYEGKWKDLGTWNTLCEELPSTYIGNVFMGDANVNTHVINELGVPLLCDGLNDTVVAASPDGILVCSKGRSDLIKGYVSNLEMRPMFEERRWGSYRVLDTTTYLDGGKSLTKSLLIKAGKSISYQIHHHRSEVWTIVDGCGEFVFDGERRSVGRGDVLNIPVGHFHAIKAITDLAIIEVQTGNQLIEEDIERFDWTW